MTRVTPGMVYDRSIELLTPTRAAGTTTTSTPLPVIA
jgi:hypothetical protein